MEVNGPDPKAEQALHLINIGAYDEGAASAVRAQLKSAQDAAMRAQDEMMGLGFRGNPTGATAYEWLSRKAGDTRAAPAEASRLLREAGIPGHSYRGDSSGVTNYVVYDDAVIKPIARTSSFDELRKMVADEQRQKVLATPGGEAVAAQLDALPVRAEDIARWVKTREAIK